jgi:hypothetical protein
MVSSSARLISIERSGMISILPPVRRQVHGTIIVELQLVSHNLPYRPYHITCPTEKKVRQFYFIFCIFYVASRAFAQELFHTYEQETTAPINILFLYFPIKGPPL